MTYKEWSEHDPEIMNDILRLIRENGGSMLADTVDENIHRFFKNKYEEGYKNGYLSFVKKLSDVEKEMIRRGWMTRDGGSFHLTDKGRRVEADGSRQQIVTEQDVERTEEILQRMAQKQGKILNMEFYGKRFLWIVLGIAVISLLLLGVIELAQLVMSLIGN